MKKGRKPVLEDGYLALPNFMGQAKQGLFSVFDGHGGVDAVRFAAEKLGENIAEAMDSEASVEDAMIAGYGNTDAQFLAKVFISEC
jgi:protein phosphatase 1L